MPIYPTKVEILETEQMFKPIVLTMIRNWKKSEWRKAKTSDDKKLALAILVSRLSTIYSKSATIEFVDAAPTSWYSPKYKRIYITGMPSIISTLHEFAHHLFGPNELKACRWSVWLFKKTFPQAFYKLKWQGHMLKKI